MKYVISMKEIAPFKISHSDNDTSYGMIDHGNYMILNAKVKNDKIYDTKEEAKAHLETIR